jgi:ADP-ribose pyrophosphatase
MKAEEAVRESWIKSDYIYTGQIFSLRVGEVRLANNQIARRDIIEHLGGIGLIPMFDDHSVIFVRQYRISIEKETLELPGGRLEPGDTPENRANLELEEEVGYKAGLMVPITNFYPSTGFSNEKRHIFLATDLQKTKQRLDWDEDLRLEILPFNIVKEKLFKGEFEDANTLIGLYGLLLYLQGITNSSF